MERIELSEKEKTKLYKHLAANYFNTLLTVAAVPILIFVAAFVFMVFDSDTIWYLSLTIGVHEINIHLLIIFGAYVLFVALFYVILKQMKINSLDRNAEVYKATGVLLITRTPGLHFGDVNTNVKYAFRDNNGNRNTVTYTCLKDAKRKIAHYKEDERMNRAESLEAFVVTTGKFTRAVPVSVIE